MFKHPMAQAKIAIQISLIHLILVYRLLISPLLGPCCRFEPSCSRYGILAIKQYGILHGSWLLITRLTHCHPWHPGGSDPVPTIDSSEA